MQITNIVSTYSLPQCFHVQKNMWNKHNDKYPIP